MAGNSVMLIAGLIFGLLGGGFIIYAQLAKKKAEAAQSWPVVEGRVLLAEVKQHRYHDSRSHRTRVSYEPVVNYSYAVEGCDYTGKKISFGATRYDSNTAHNIIAPYTPGNGVNVHYDPAHPEKAVLETEAPGTKIFLIAGIIFALLGLILILFGML